METTHGRLENIVGGSEFFERVRKRTIWFAAGSTCEQGAAQCRPGQIGRLFQLLQPMRISASVSELAATLLPE